LREVGGEVEELEEALELGLGGTREQEAGVVERLQGFEVVGGAEEGEDVGEERLEGVGEEAGASAGVGGEHERVEIEVGQMRVAWCFIKFSQLSS